MTGPLQSPVPVSSHVPGQILFLEKSTYFIWRSLAISQLIESDKVWTLTGGVIVQDRVSLPILALVYL